MSPNIKKLSRLNFKPVLILFVNLRCLLWQKKQNFLICYWKKLRQNISINFLKFR